MKLIEQLINELKLADVDKAFPNVPEELRTKAKKDFKKKMKRPDIPSVELDKRGVILLGMHRAGNIPAGKAGLVSGYLKALEDKNLARVYKFEDLKKAYDEQKANVGKEVSKSTVESISSKKFPTETLYFPHTKEQLIAKSADLAKKDKSGTEGANVNHWCVAVNDEGRGYYEAYMKNGSRFVLVVKSNNERYLFSQNEHGAVELADKMNGHLELGQLKVSDEAKNFLEKFYSVSMPKRQKKEEKNTESVIKSLLKKELNFDFSKGTLTLRDDQEFDDRTLYKAYLISRGKIKVIKNAWCKPDNDVSFNNLTGLKEIHYRQNKTLTGDVPEELGSLYGCSDLKLVVLPTTSSTLNIDKLFHGCYKLVKIENLEKITPTSLVGTFHRCRALKSLPSMNMSEVKNANRAFYDCNSLYDLDMSNSNSWKFKSLPSNRNRIEFEHYLDYNRMKELQKRNPETRFFYDNELFTKKDFERHFENDDDELDLDNE